MVSNFEQIYTSLFQYCKAREFAGFDPFDGLNSRIFQITPLKYLAPARLAWLQLVKRSPVDLRPLLLVEKGENAKGIALFALAELSRFRSTGDDGHRDMAVELLMRLDGHTITGTSADGRPTLAFGYNFDWQSRQFFAPKNTPTVVPTAFAARAYIEAYEALGDEKYLKNARRICEFITAELQRPIETDDEICFSYTPNDRGVIYNASLLAGETLATVGAMTGNDDYLDLAARSARYVIRQQNENGSWFYGPKLRHKWVDNFHTAYVLLSLNRIATSLSGSQPESDSAIRRGIEFWLNRFFLSDGTPKYFESHTSPIDIHSAAAAVWALTELKNVDERAMPLARKVAEWTIANMRDTAGFFYYQKRNGGVVKTAFMRWGQAWMALALSRLIEFGEDQTPA